MSLILEALRKSEAERQLGRAPGLMSPTIRVSRRRGLSPWWGILGLALAIGAGAAWWVRTQAPEARVAAQAPAVATEPAPAPESAPASAPPSPAATPAAALPEAVVPAPTEIDAALPRDPEFASVERESVPLPAQATPAPPVPTPAVPAAPPATPEPPAATTILPPMPAPPPTALPAAPLPTVDATPPPPAPAELPLEALPRVDELMPDVRHALPPLKLTMHAYAPAPASRFVLIDGKRYATGDRLSNALVVSEIRPDGAVLDFDGKRFLVPRP